MEVPLLSTWTPNYTKLLISIKKEKQANFTSGKMRKKEAWSTVAEAFNATDGVVARVTSEQCANKWKKLEEKFKKTEEHNAKTGRERKTCEFYEELSDCLGDNPKIIPVVTVSSAKAVASTNQREEASTTDDSNDESSTLDSTSPTKKRRKETPKKRRRSKSSACEMIDFLNEFREEKKKEDQERVILIERMHADKMKVMERFLSIMDKT
ncbi:hypothetical protein ABFA07_022156 [Porites harrisoni]